MLKTQASPGVLHDYLRDLLQFAESGELPVPSDPAAEDLITDSGVQHIAVSRYTDEARCEQEKTHIFRRYPQVLGHASEIPSGHCRSHDATGVPLIIANDDGNIRVFLNQCRHRSTRLLNSPQVCEKKSIICPYHRWVYGLNGDLRSVPHSEIFPGLETADHGLIELPSAVRSGLIFAMLTPQADMDIDRDLDGITPYLDGLGTGEFMFFKQSDRSWNCNWKLPIDAFLEAYHLYQLHVDTLAPLFMDNMALARRHGLHLSAAVARKDMARAREQAMGDWDLRNLVTFTLYLMPNTVIIYHPDYTSIVSFYPETATRCRIVHSMLIPEEPANDAARGHWQRAFELTDGMSFGDEDFMVCEQMQAGMAAGGMSELTLGTSESGIYQFHHILDEMALRAQGN